MLKLLVVGVVLFILWIFSPIWKVTSSHSVDSTFDTNNKPHNNPDLVAEDYPQRGKIVSSPSPKPAESFTCDGRQYCSQMRSYEEAKYFLDHCSTPRHPMKMDGDGDGIPCERQFGRH